MLYQDQRKSRHVKTFVVDSRDKELTAGPWTQSNVDFGTSMISDDTDLADINEKMKGKRVIVRGYFDHKNEVLLGTRTAPPGVFEAAQGLVTNPQGYFVITPFIRQDDKTVVFVNRGWVPIRSTSWDRPTELVTIACVVSDFEKV